MKFNPDEIKAFEQALPALGQHVATNGLGDKTFNTMTRDEILGVMAATVREFREQFNTIMGDIPW